MRVPLSWLREFVAIDLPFDDLLEVMGRNGLEIDEVRRPGAGVSGVRVARILSVEQHPDADKLVVARIDAGGEERTVCAGARNIAAGDLVPYAPPGATLPDGQGGTWTLEQRKMRGIVSDGMLCSPRELQLADEHGGILVLDRELEPGTDITDVFPLGEPVLDIAVPADRGDLHSVLGIARDLAAILDTGTLLPYDDPSRVEEIREDGPVPVGIEALDGCGRYVGWAVEGVTVAASPWWLRQRLEACGVRSISNLVDVTNYVMLELGQPLHAFDLDALHGPEIVVRWAEEGEHLRTLDGRDRTLRADDLVIADADRAVALAGVMGGEDTEVGEGTHRVLLEAAWFDPAAIRRTSRRLGLVSEASNRFERRVDPAGTWRAAARAVELLTDLAGARDLGARVAGEPERVSPDPIRLDPPRTAAFLGLPDLDADTQATLLARAHVPVERDGDDLVATPPSWRGDLERPADLAEEIARLHGYERIPATLPPVVVRGGLSARQRAERALRAGIAGLGFTEVLTYPFVGDDALVLLHADDTGRVELRNPISREAQYLRPSLAEGLLAVARRNVGQGRAGFAAYEIGRVFRAADGPLADERWRWRGPDGEELPDQPVTLGLVAFGVHLGDRWLDRDRPHDLFDLLAAADEAVRRLRPGDALERVPAGHPALHPGRTAALRWDGRDIGLVGQLHPREAERRDLPEDTLVGELLLEPLWAHLQGQVPLPQAPTLARHPAVSIDVAVVADLGTPFADVERAVREGAGDLLADLRWFDEYRGAQVGEGRRSLAFNLRLQAPDRQLTDADAEAVIDRVDDAVSAVGGSLRR